MTKNKLSYNKPHCWQYDLRIKNLDKDLKDVGLTKKEIKTLKVSDFKFRYVDKSEALKCREIKEFIVRHEWLGKMPHRPTHRFIATYKEKLAGVIVMATPNAFSNLLGKDKKDLEKLISRGACISWSPKNLGSSLVMFSIKWMVKNTNFRFFTAYSDVEARELGTIYQACNFTYLGQNSGARYEYFDPQNPNLGWFSDRRFRKVTSYKKYASLLEINWQKSWNNRDRIHWDKVPNDIKRELKNASWKHQQNCQKRNVLPKHKYLYILGKDNRETESLRKLFSTINPDKINLSYPKSRGPQKLRGHALINQVPDHILTNRPQKWWPSNDKKKILYTLKEISNMYGISLWLLYKHIESDPNFPFFNVGLKKKYLIHLEKFENWLTKKSKKNLQKNLNLPTSEELLGV